MRTPTIANRCSSRAVTTRSLAALVTVLAFLSPFAAGCRPPAVVGVRILSQPAPPDAAAPWPFQCEIDPLNAPPDPVALPAPDPQRPSSLAGTDVWDRSFVHIRDLDPRDAYAREMAAQLEDVRVCLLKLREQRERGRGRQ